MTLYRQLIIFTLCLFFLLFTGSWLAKFESTRSFLINQLESHAQDTATSLGLSISSRDGAGDMATVEGMVNAVFDRGYYESIRLTDTNNKTVLERKLKVTIENVPQWFISLVPLKTPEATANTMSGWRRSGTVQVKSHPGYAYHTLWEDAVRMTLWFVACGILVLAGGAVGLRILLKPLSRVEQQADALCRREYEVQKKLPWTKDLRSVVEAMNRMTLKVKEMFEEQVLHTESLREWAYHDVLTGLGNRRYFESQVNAYLDIPESPKRGVLLLLQINDLSTLNLQKGLQAGDDLVKRVGELIRESFVQCESAIMSRLTGGDSAIFLPDVQPWVAESVTSTLTDRLRQVAAEGVSLTDQVGHVGVSVFDGSVTLARILSEADAALAAARQTGPNAWNIRVIGGDDAEKTPLGQFKWKELLEKALDERRIVVEAQPVVAMRDPQQILHLEVFSRVVREDGEGISASLFMPFAERMKLVSTLDRLVLEKVRQYDRRQLPAENVAVNISASSLQDLTFRQWVENFLSNLPPSSPRLIFEFAEYGAVQNLQVLRDFRTVLEKQGHGIALDHFGRSFSNLGYLQSLRPDYVKIDRAYTGELKDQENDTRFYISSLCRVAHSIDVAVIAEGVETEQQYRILQELNLDAAQGYFFKRPRPMEESLT